MSNPMSNPMSDPMSKAPPGPLLGMMMDFPLTLSAVLRRAETLLAFKAVRRATPCSQSPRTARVRSEAALRTRTKKMAWNASSASSALPRIRRQTPSTIGPCRRTSAVNAVSSRPARNCRRSWPSDWLSALEQDVLSALVNLGCQRAAAEMAVKKAKAAGAPDEFEVLFRKSLELVR